MTLRDAVANLASQYKKVAEDWSCPAVLQRKNGEIWAEKRKQECLDALDFATALQAILADHPQEALHTEGALLALHVIRAHLNTVTVAGPTLGSWNSAVGGVDALINLLQGTKPDPDMPAQLPAPPSVPLADLDKYLSYVGLAPAEAAHLRNWLAQYRPPPAPNPHPAGTYHWAREEHARGATVFCRLETGAPKLEVGQSTKWEQVHFTAAEFDAANWVSVRPAAEAHL
jgi:hypothetical protein